MPRDEPNWLTTALQKLDAVTLAPRAAYRGRVEEIGDGVALISGLPDVGLDEVGVGEEEAGAG